MMPSGHKAFVVSNVRDVELLLMHNKVYAAEYVYPSARIVTRDLQPRGETRAPGDMKGMKKANTQQDRPQRLLKEADRHHCPREAIIRQGHQPQGEGYHRGLSGLKKCGGGGVLSNGSFHVSYGIRRSINGKGFLLFGLRRVCSWSGIIPRMLERNETRSLFGDKTPPVLWTLAWCLVVFRCDKPTLRDKRCDTEVGRIAQLRQSGSSSRPLGTWHGSTSHNSRQRTVILGRKN